MPNSATYSYLTVPEGTKDSESALSFRRLANGVVKRVRSVRSFLKDVGEGCTPYLLVRTENASGYHNHYIPFPGEVATADIRRHANRGARCANSESCAASKALIAEVQRGDDWGGVRKEVTDVVNSYIASITSPSQTDEADDKKKAIPGSWALKWLTDEEEAECSGKSTSADA